MTQMCFQSPITAVKTKNIENYKVNKSFSIFCLFAVILFFNNSLYSQVILAGWDFPTTAANPNPNSYISANASSTINLVNVNVSNSITYTRNGASTFSASANQWQNGSGFYYFAFNDISTVGYSNITFSLKMGDGNLKSPRDFQIQYRTNNGTWTDVGSAIVFQNTWTDEATNLLLSNAANQADVDIRILQTSNVSIENGAIGKGPLAWVGVDDIYINGNIIPTITTSAISSTTFCSGASVSVPYTILGTYNSGNIFTAQLSDASGSFASPVTIGTLVSTASGTISATIPANTATGTGYRIRVVSSNPAITGTDNGTNLSIYIFPSAPTTTGSFICIGATSGTVLSASGAVSGEVYKWYSAASAGTLLKTSSNSLDNTYTTATITTTTSYWVSISNAAGCETARTQVTATYPSASAADQTLAGTDSWIGHIYDGANLNTYYGTVTQTELIDQNFTGSNTCFPFTSGADSYSIRTETFSVRYRMNSTRKGLYTVDLGSDDGSRLYVDGNLVYNDWTNHGFTSRPRVLVSLTGSSPLIYDFYENSGQNRIVFQNFTSVLSNTLTTNTTQTINLGSTGTAISGDVFGALPTGISLSGTGYQWTYSTTPGGVRTNIAGATGATFTPDASVAPFNAVGTYYIYRNAVLSSTNNVLPSAYVATNESNVATLTVTIPTIVTSVSSLPLFSYNTGAGPSAEQSFTVSGSSLTTAIVITPTANFEISTTSGSAFQSTPITLNQTSGTVNDTPIYVRLKAGLPNGTYSSDSILVTSTGATSKTVTLSGLVNAVYCASSGNTAFLTSITLVSFNSINNVSAKPSGYSNYTAQTTNVYAGGNYNLTVNLNTDGNYTVFAIAQFDWNNDGDFVDVGESYSLGSTTNNANGITSLCPLSIRIPLTATIGNVRMRIAAKWDIEPTACENGFDGEVEDYTLIIAPPTLQLSATPTTLTNFTYPFTTGPSTIQTFNVNGFNLTDNVIVTASTNFEVSTTGGVNFSAQPFLTLPASGAAVNQTVYVRMKAGLNIGTILPDTIVVSTTGATDINVICSGLVTAQPLITINLTTLSGFTTNYKGTASAKQNFTISGSNLVGNITLAAPTGFEIKTSSQSTYSSTLTLTQTGGAVAITTINVRLKSGLGVGAYTGNIVASSANADNKTVLVSGDVLPIATLTTSTSWLAGFIYSGVGPSASQSFQLIGTNLAADVTITPPTDFELSPDNTTWYATAFTVARVGTGVNKTMYARLKANKTSGVAYGPENVSLSSTGAVVKTVALSGYVANTATILVSKNALNGFGYLFGSGPSVTQKFTVSGALLTNNITIAPPTNFEILNTVTGLYQTTPISIPLNGTTIAATDVTIRLKAGIAAGNYSGNVDVSSTGATSKTVALTGKVFASPLITSGGGGNYCLGDNITLTSNGTDVQSQFWTGPNNFYSILPNPVITNATTNDSGIYTVTGNVIVGGNLIVNGDFEMGNVGFSSSYGYVKPVASALVPEGLYTVTTFGHDVHNNFNTVPDKNFIGTQQMVINGNVTAGAVVWTQSVPVVPNSDYEFSYWLQTVVNGVDAAPSKLQLYVNGEIAGPIYTANPASGNWTQYIYNTASGLNNILNLELINQTTAANGNDFALDSISFKQILSATSTQNVQVAPSVTPLVTVTHSPATIYQNTPVVFTAIPVNGGATPSYKWFVGGIEQVGQTSSTFSYTPTGTGSLTVSCQMTSSITCAAPNPASGTDNINVQLPIANYWMGSIDTDWNKDGNWTANYVPATGDNVIYATVSNYGSAAMRDLQLDKNRIIGSLINATIKRLIIPANLTLTCNNVITVTPPVTNPITKPEDLIIIKANLTLANGSIIYRNPQNSPVFGTVEMYSPASWDLTRPARKKFNWQYVGIPLASLPVLPTFYGTYVRELIESDPDTATHWRMVSNDYVMQPFKGYELCQQLANTLYTFKGQLVNADFNSGQLAKTLGALYPGQHLFANPYTSAIDIRQIEFGPDMEATAYLYNTGTFYSWLSNPNKSVLLENVVPGQYNSAPKLQAGSFPGIPRQVPSMSTFLVRILNTKQSSPACYVKVIYNTVAMGNLDRLKVKAKSVTDEQTSTEIIVEGEYGADKMWIMTHDNYSHNFDNGYDGKKLVGTAMNPQIYAVEGDGNYQLNSVKDIDNTIIAFQAGVDSIYTLKFTHNENTLMKYKNIYLHDMIADKIVTITESGSSYQFKAKSTNKPVARFRILASNTTEDLKNNINTKVYSFDRKIFVQNFSDFDGKVYVYDISGRTLGIKNISANENIHFNVSQNKIYLVKVVVGSINETKKILLQ